MLWPPYQTEVIQYALHDCYSDRTLSLAIYHEGREALVVRRPPGTNLPFMIATA